VLPERELDFEELQDKAKELEVDTGGPEVDVKEIEVADVNDDSVLDTELLGLDEACCALDT
jgi:hypothetical protein